MGNPWLSDFYISEYVSHGMAGMETQRRGKTMNWQGWMFILIVWGFVGSLFFYSFYRILFGGQRNKRRKNFK